MAAYDERAVHQMLNVRELREAGPRVEYTRQAAPCLQTSVPIQAERFWCESGDLAYSGVAYT